ncbi:MAG: TetR/AcrR family transcriptional regulator, partial [Pseudomonadota bacterium]
MSNSTSEMKSAEPSKRRAGPKRSEASKAAVLEAAYAELSEHGWRGFSVDRVAKEARASKQTIYRWWRTPARLAVDAALEKMPKSAQAEGDARIRIEAIVAPLVRATRTGDGAHAWRSALLAAADDAEAGEAFRAWFNDTVKRPLRHVLAEQANKGRIRRDWDVDLAVEMLAGPIWHRLIAMRSL